MQTKAVLLVGAGSFGTALALYLSRLGHTVYMYGWETERLTWMREHRQTKDYLPGYALPDTLHPICDLKEISSVPTDWMIALPSHAFAEVMQKMKAEGCAPSRAFWVTKGLEPIEAIFLHEAMAKIFGKIPMGVLAGPSFAAEIANGLPTALTLAVNDAAYARDLIDFWHSPLLRVYTSTDLIGVQLGGVLKNLYAIAAGLVDGLKLGANMRSSLLTRAMTEMMQIAKVLGADPKTMMGLSGLGDLILTATDNQSRNRRFGLYLGEGQSVETALATIQQTVEGYQNVSVVERLLARHPIEAPITQALFAILTRHQAADLVLSALLDTASQPEFDGL